jgi:hypothetical protein
MVVIFTVYIVILQGFLSNRKKSPKLGKGYRLQATGNRQQATGHRLQATGFGKEKSHCEPSLARRGNLRLR